MSIKRLTPKEAASAIAANHRASSAQRQSRVDLAQAKLDEEDRGFYDGIGWLARCKLIRNRKQMALFIRQVVSTAHDRGAVTDRQGVQLIRCADNRLYPHGK